MGRLIPARAGKTTVAAVGSLTVTAHPRAGGENRGVTMHALRHSGSSPRGRGKPHATACDALTLRLIPARAGKTSSIIVRTSTVPAHPRAGGENDHDDLLTIPAKGSSPRGRGKPGRLPAAQTGVRLIPARAGKTCPRTRRA